MSTRKASLTLAFCGAACLALAADWPVKDNTSVRPNASGTVMADAPVSHAFPSSLNGNVLFSFDCTDTNGWTFTESNGVKYVTKLPSSNGNGRYLASTPGEGAFLPWSSGMVPPAYGGSASSTLNGQAVLDFGSIGSKRALVFDAVDDATLGGKANILDNIRTVIAVFNSAYGGGCFLGGGYGYNEMTRSTTKVEYQRGNNPRVAWSAQVTYSSPVVKHPASWDFIWGWLYHDGGVTWPGRAGFNGGWEVLSAVFKDTNNAYGIGLGLTTSSPQNNGGQRIAEMYFFDKVLTGAERGAVENYLLHKWFGRSLPGWDGDARVGTLRPYKDGTVENGRVNMTANVAAGEKVSVSTLKGGRWGATFTKTGEGTLSVDTAEHYGPGITLNGGTLEFPRATTEGASLPGGAVLLHFDASDASSLTTETEGGVTYVTGWKNLGNMTFRSEAAANLVACAPSAAARPVLVADALGSGRPVLDFGDYGSGRYLEFRLAPAKEQVIVADGAVTAFAVVDTTHSGGHLLGNTAVTSASYYADFSRAVNNLQRQDDSWMTVNDFRLPMWTTAPKTTNGVEMRHKTMSGTNGVTFVDGRRIDPARGYPHPGWQVVAVQTIGDFVSAIGKSGAHANAGGLRLAELVVYSRVLTDAEMLAAQAYLSSKWTQTPVAGYARANDEGHVDATRLNVTGTAAVSVAGAGSARVGSLTGSGVATKTGSGTLEVMDVRQGANLTVAEGKVKLLPRPDVATDSEIAPDAAFHVDASDANSFLFHVANGTNYVSQWHDTDRPKTGIVAYEPTASRMPWRITEGDGLCNGLPVVDFGPNGEANGGRMMAWTESIDAIRHAYLVVRPHGTMQCLLGTTMFPSDGGGSSYDFMGNGSGFFLRTMANQMIWGTGALVLVNGVAVATDSSTIGGYVFADEFQLVEFHTASGAHASAFACDRVNTSYGNYTAQRGGQYLAEVVVYDRELTEREKVATRNRLMAKWLNAATQTVPAKTADVASFATLAVDGGTVESAKPIEVSRLVMDDGAIESTPGIAVDTLEGSLSVPAGCTLTLRKSGVVSPDGFATNGLMAHFDANQGVTYHTDFTDTRAVREWADVSGNGWKCVPLVDTEANAPLRVADSQGRKYMRLYWNKQNGLRFMKNGQFAEMTGIRTVFWVIDSEIAGGYLLGGGHTPDNASRHYNFHRGNPIDGASFGLTKKQNAFLNASFADSAALNANWRLNATSVSSTTTGFTELWNVLSMRTVDTPSRPSTSAEGFAFDGRFLDSNGASYADKCGCLYLSEALFYDRVLTDAECRQVEAYLSRKWQLGVYNEDVSDNPPGVALAAGSSLDLNGREHELMSLSGEGTVTNGTAIVGELAAGGDAARAETLAAYGDIEMADGATWRLAFNDDGSLDVLSADGRLTFGSAMRVELDNLANMPPKPFAVKIAEATSYGNAERLRGAVFDEEKVGKNARFRLKLCEDGVYLTVSPLGFTLILH